MTTTREVDHLVVGAGASGMALVDTLVAHSDAEVLLVDRRHQPGGHWNAAYPFVRLHQPSAYYGVASRPLGHDRIDTAGRNAGFYERATAAELCDYYQRVLVEHLMPTGQVEFMGMTDHLGTDGAGIHRLRARLTGEIVEVTVRRRVVDATYVESAIPATHRRPFACDEDAVVVSPAQLVDLGDAPAGFTVLGGGKTAMDVVVWLLDHGVDPDAIGWVRPREGWTVDRRYTQPLDLLPTMLDYQATLVEVAASLDDPAQLLSRMEEHGMFRRVDRSVPAEVFRGAVLATGELDALATVANVVRMGRVRRVGPDRLSLVDGEVATAGGRIHVDCTAAGLADRPLRPIFEPGQITVQFTTAGIAPLSAATIGRVEALDTTDGERNALCPPIPRTGLAADQLGVFALGMAAEGTRRTHPELAAWSADLRLNPMRALPRHLDDPGVQASLARLLHHVDAAQTVAQRLRP